MMSTAHPGGQLSIFACRHAGKKITELGMFLRKKHGLPEFVFWGGFCGFYQWFWLIEVCLKEKEKQFWDYPKFTGSFSIFFTN